MRFKHLNSVMGAGLYAPTLLGFVDDLSRRKAAPTFNA
jgi:hypothetical protein